MAKVNKLDTLTINEIKDYIEIIDTLIYEYNNLANLEDGTDKMPEIIKKKGIAVSKKRELMEEAERRIIAL